MERFESSRWSACAVGIALALSSCTGGNQKKDAPDEATRVELPKLVPASTKTVDVKAPRRVILLIGDGMGVPVVSAAAYAKGAPLEMLQMPHVSVMRTHEHEHVTTDSAASATAMATGNKTHFQGVSVKPGTVEDNEADPAQHLRHMVEAARAEGLKTGLVATARIVHATPAAFASHRYHRRRYEEIALDMSSAGVDVMLGAGTKFFNARKDGVDLFAKMEDAGYTIAETPEAVQAARVEATKLVGLLHEKDMPLLARGERKMALAELTEVAIEVLDRDNPNGFFLMVEGSFIDWEEHDMNGGASVMETLDFDEAVGVVRRYAASRDDVLVVVTADHETGGLILSDPAATSTALEALGGKESAEAMVAATPKVVEERGGLPFAPAVETRPLGDGPLRPAAVLDQKMTLMFGFLSVASRQAWPEEGFSATHTATMVPLFAEGAGAEYIEQVRDNAGLGESIMSLLGVEDGASVEVAEDAFASETPRNIVVMIAPGAGLATLTATEYVHGPLTTTTFPVRGLVATHPTDGLVNDAAGAATAIATGQDVPRGALGMNAAGEHAQTLLEAAELANKRTGLVTTGTLTDPTLAAFYAHLGAGASEADRVGALLSVAARLPGTDGIDVLFGGRSAELDAAMKARGVTPPTTKPDASLATLTEDALGALADQNPEGFVLVVEGQRIEELAHALTRDASLLDEVAEFDAAVDVAKTVAQQRGDTLVVVLADRDQTLSVLDAHYGFNRKACAVAKRCGGTVEFIDIPVQVGKVERTEGFADAKQQGDFAPPVVLLQYAWGMMAAQQADPSYVGTASANFVPVFAYGPSAESLGGFKTLAQIGKALAMLVK